MTEPAAATPATPAVPVLEGARPRLRRYRVMAWVTGSMLLVLCLEMVLKYVFHANGYELTGEPKPVIGTWVAIVHGWIYVVYLVTVVQLWSAMRWSLGRLVTMALAGVVPVMSFILERRVHADAVARIDGTPGR
jgi:integral membrane protein